MCIADKVSSLLSLSRSLALAALLFHSYILLLSLSLSLKAFITNSRRYVSEQTTQKHRTNNKKVTPLTSVLKKQQKKCDCVQSSIEWMEEHRKAKNHKNNMTHRMEWWKEMEWVMEKRRKEKKQTRQIRNFKTFSFIILSAQKEV